VAEFGEGFAGGGEGFGSEGRDGLEGESEELGFGDKGQGVCVSVYEFEGAADGTAWAKAEEARELEFGYVAAVPAVVGDKSVPTFEYVVGLCDFSEEHEGGVQVFGFTCPGCGAFGEPFLLCERRDVSVFGVFGHQGLPSE